MDARIDRVTGPANSWIVGDDDEVIVIDPGDATAVLDVVGDREVLAVICTHGHAGHVAAALAVAERDEAPVALHPADKTAWHEVHPDDVPDIDMEDGGAFGVADVTLDVLHAPGHTRGSVCLYSEELDVVFTGDVVTSRGPVARDDGYPDFSRQLDSIGAQILTLPSGTRILPGHGEQLTVSQAEKSFDSWAVSRDSRAVEADAD